MSGAGWALVVVTLLLGASAFPTVRPKLLGLSVHPLTMGAVVLFLAGIGRLNRVPRAVALGLACFVACFSLSCLIGPAGGMGFIAKIVATAVTLVVGAIYIDNERDQRAVILALTLAVALISIRGLYVIGGVGAHGINPMEGIANKNGFSLFALPTLLLAGFIAIKPQTPVAQRWILIAGMVFISFAIFSTANRSGWIGVILIVFLLLVRAVRSLRTMVMLTVVTAAAATVVMLYAERLVFQDRLEKTTAEAPQLRVKLATMAFEVGLANPILGASPQGLPWEMPKLTGVRGQVFDTHNVTGLLAGGTGAVGLLSFAVLAWVLWRRPRWFAQATPVQRDAHYLLRAMMIVWIVRGQFTAEILYSPSFSLALGLCIGGCVMTGVWGPGPRAMVRRIVQRTPVEPRSPAPLVPVPPPLTPTV